MTTAIIGIGHIGGTVARELAAGGESVVLSAVNTDNVNKLASAIGGPGTAASSNRNAVQGANTVVVALWLGPVRGVIEDGAGRRGPGTPGRLERCRRRYWLRGRVARPGPQSSSTRRTTPRRRRRSSVLSGSLASTRWEWAVWENPCASRSAATFTPLAD